MTRFLSRPRAPLLAATLGFALSRLAFFGAGVRFDATTLTYFWQYIDPPLLRTDLWRSLLYHHAQPPLFNLYLGTVLGLAPEGPETLFWVAQMGVGLALLWGIAGLLGALGVGRWASAACALAFAISPSAILYENWLFYTQPVAALLLASAVALHRLVARGYRTVDALAFFSLLALLVLTRSLFHVAWMTLVLAAVAWRSGPRRRPVLLGAALPFAAVLAVHLKNLWLFGTFATSSWLGMNLARITVEPQPPELLVSKVAAGELSDVTLVRPFSPLSQYPPALRAPDARLRAASVDHPVLTARRKAGGDVNFNHLAYVSIARAYRGAALAVVRESPRPYLRKMLDGWLFFCASPSVYWFFEENYHRIKGYEDTWNIAVYGTLPERLADRLFDDPDEVPEERRHRTRALRNAGWLSVALAVWALARATRRGFRGLREENGDPARAWTLLYVSSAVVYVALLANSIEYLENNRFRFLIEPLLWCLVAWALAGVLAGVVARRRVRAGSPAPEH